MMCSIHRLGEYYQLVRSAVIDDRSHSYYGVDRHFAGGVNWDESPAKEVWKEYVCAPWEDLGEWDAFFPTLEIARDFQRHLASHGYPFSILCIYPCESESDVAAIEDRPGYLGLDVASTEPLSVLRPEWLWDEIAYWNEPDPLRALWALPPKYFRERVNKWGLLSRFEDAALFRDVVRALERVDVTHQTPQSVRVLAVQEVLD